MKNRIRLTTGREHADNYSEHRRYQDSLHHRPCVRFFQSVNSTDPIGNGCCTHQLLPWNLRSAHSRHQNDSTGQRTSPPSCSHSPRPAWTKTASRQTRKRTSSPSKARQDQPDNQANQREIEDTDRISGPSQGRQERRYDIPRGWDNQDRSPTNQEGRGRRTRNQRWRSDFGKGSQSSET